MPKRKLMPELEKKLKIPEPAPAPELMPLPDKPIITRHRRTKAEIEAGRQPAITLEANPLFIPIIKMPFDLWSANTKLDAIKLTDDEVKNVALPITQLANYYFPKIPVIAMAWANLIILSYGLMSARLNLIKNEKTKKEIPPIEQTAA